MDPSEENSGSIEASGMPQYSIPSGDIPNQQLGGMQQHSLHHRVDDGSSGESAPMNDIDDVTGKIFIGGLSWQTTEANLRYYFEKYGELTDVALMIDKRSGKPRGFGFIKMKDSAAADAILQNEHTIDGRLVDVKRALPRDQAPGPTRSESCKIFVGGLSSEVTEKEFGDYFSKFGIVKDAVVMVDRNTGMSRGFGFVTFEREDVVEYVMKQEHEIMGKYVEIKKAEPRDSRGGPNDPPYGGYGNNYGYGGAGGYGGGQGGGFRGGRGGGRGFGGRGGGGSYGGGMNDTYGGYGGGMGGGYMARGGGGYRGGYPAGYGGAAYGGRGGGGYGGGMGAGPSPNYGYAPQMPQQGTMGYAQYTGGAGMGGGGGFAGYGSAAGAGGAYVAPVRDNSGYAQQGNEYRGQSSQGGYDNSALAGYANAAMQQQMRSQAYAYGASNSTPQGYSGGDGYSGGSYGSSAPSGQATGPNNSGAAPRMNQPPGGMDNSGAPPQYSAGDANQQGYGAYRGQNSQGRAERSFRPY